jgi:transposase, IS5 family
MFRTLGDPVSLWELRLPPEVLRLPEELARVDALLDDPVFFAPFAPYFHPVIGRPCTPAECYLRLMFLKFRYRLGFESLCAEVADSISWRRFCRIPLDGKVPHPTTLMKLTTRCGPAAVECCNEALLAKAAEAKLLRTSRLRADTTVVPANVAYPTDSGLLAKAIRRIAATGRRIQAAGGATRTRVPDRSRSAGARAHGIASRLGRRVGREEAQAGVRRITGELAGLAERAAADAGRLLANGRGALRRATGRARDLAVAGVRDAAAGRRRSRLRRAVNDLADLLEVTWRIAAQTRQRLAGITPDGATRRVSLHDQDARPIAKGRLGKPAGVRLQGPARRQRLRHCLGPQRGTRQPRRRPAARPRRRRVITRTRRRPRTVTADRGYGEKSIEDDPQRGRVRRARRHQPDPASSGRTSRHRLNRGGDRDLNRAIHAIAVCRIRSCPRTRAYVTRRTAEGKTAREIRRCLKR